MLGCHLLLRLDQILQGQQPCDSMAHEVCRLLMGSSQVNDGMELLTMALSGLATDTTTAAHGGQLLCMLAEAAFRPPCHVQPHQQRAPTARAGGKNMQPPPGATLLQSTVEAANSAAAEGLSTDQGCDGSGALLQLLADVIEAISSNSCTQQQAAVLAAAVLPSLMPAGLLAARPAARKCWCHIAGIAATAVLPAKGDKLQVHYQQPASPVMLNSTAPAIEHVADAEDLAAAAATTSAHVAGMAVLAAAAQHDRDATVRCRALGLLNQACPFMWQHFCFWKVQQAKHLVPKGQNESADQRSSGWVTPEAKQVDATAAIQYVQSSISQKSLVADAITGDHHNMSDVAHICNAVVVEVAASWDALTAALQSQLVGTSKASRIKALQLLQHILQALEPEALRRVGAAQPTGSIDSNSVCNDMLELQQQQQQQLVLQLHDAISAVFEAPQEHPWHCPASKGIAEQLLPLMSQVGTALGSKLLLARPDTAVTGL